METEFKVGDRVRLTQVFIRDIEGGLSVGDEGTVKEGKTMLNGALVNFPSSNREGKLHGCLTEQLELVRSASSEKSAPPKFLLRYDRESDPVEEFATLPEVRTRVKELLSDRSVKRDSFKVYEIKNVLKVKVDERVSISAK